MSVTHFHSGVAGSRSGIFDPFSLDFDNSTEALQNNTIQTISIGADWTWVCWFRPSSVTDNGTIFECSNQPGDDDDINRIFFNYVDDEVHARLYNSSGTIFKHLEFDTVLSLDTWVQLVVTFTSDNPMVLYADGSSVAVTTTITDSAGTMTSTDRAISIGKRLDDGFPLGGLVHSTALISSALSSSAVTSIYNGGNGRDLDLRYNKDDYAVADDLEHYWRHGLDSSDIGRDYGVAGTLIDVGDNADNITAADIVTESPS